MSSNFGFKPDYMGGVFVDSLDTIQTTGLEVTTEATAGNVTYTIKELQGGLILRDPAGAARTDVLPTIALVVSDGNLRPGQALKFSIRNTADAPTETVTLTVGSGMTAHSSTDLVLYPGETNEYLLHLTSGTAGTLYQITGNNAKSTTGAQAVTQPTNVTSDVTLNALSGVITTKAASAAAGAADTFTFNNSFITASSVVLVTVHAYSGTLLTNGIPYVFVDSVTAGSCDINLANVHASAALAGTFVLHFTVIR